MKREEVDDDHAPLSQEGQDEAPINKVPEEWRPAYVGRVEYSCRSVYQSDSDSDPLELSSVEACPNGLGQLEVGLSFNVVEGYPPWTRSASTADLEGRWQ